jgi:hypothetical protein
MWDFNWYMMPPNIQREFQLMLAKAQKPIGMEMPMIGPLNVELFVDIQKSIYSYFMMLLNFIS